MATEFVNGRLMLAGHRITMSQLLGELLEISSEKIHAVANDFDLDEQQLKIAYWQLCDYIKELNHE